MMYNGGMGSGIFGLVFWVIIIVAIVVVTMWMFRSNSPSDSSSLHPGNDSLSTLKERLARGEISEEDYDRLRQKILE